MASKYAFLVSLLLSPAAQVLASPHLQAHLARSHVRGSSKPIRQLEHLANGVLYVENWAGAMWAEANETFNFATGTFTVPAVSGKNGVAAAAWVGIDGYTCQNAILQTGVQFVAGANGETDTFAWYEWYPDVAYNFTNIPVSVGDTIKATVIAFNATSGIALIDNLTTGHSVHKYLTSSYALCGQNAEWIVEDYTNDDGTLVPFGDFGTVTFTDALAFSQTGALYTPNGATLADIKQNGTVLTSVSTKGDSVTIKYV